MTLFNTLDYACHKQASLKKKKKMGVVGPFFFYIQPVLSECPMKNSVVWNHWNVPDFS